LAVLDDDLPMMAGLDAAVLIRSYAPSARVVLFTEDPAARRAGEAEGITVAEALFSAEHIAAVIRDAMAA
jgi:DNA-binding NarL/FixJ family response regulator